MIVRKILHTADLHLGAKNVRLPIKQQRQLSYEHLSALPVLFQTDCDVVLICGDLFHSNFVTQKIKRAFFKEVEKFARPVLYINGNHDDKINFDTLPNNFYILDETNNVFRTENVDFWAKSLDYQGFDYNKKNILLMHGEIFNKNDNDYIELDKYVSKPFDYIALGHEHSFWKGVYQKSKMCYSGCLFPNGFDECGEKGFVMVDCEDKINFNFQPLKQRQFKIFEITVPENTVDRVEKIGNIINKNTENLIRMVISGYYSEDENMHLSKEVGLFYAFYIEIVDKTKVKINIEKYKNEPLSFKAEFIKLVEQANLDEDVKNKILTIGIEALKGDDLSL